MTAYTQIGLNSKTRHILTPDISDPTDFKKSKQALQDEIEYLRRQLAEHEAASGARINQLDSLSSALQESEKRYDSLFSQLPRGLQEEDYSLIKKAIDKLQAEGVEDLKQYFNHNPKFLRELVGLVEITNVNQALLEIHQEASLQKYLEGKDNIDDWWDDNWTEYYASEFAALAGPDKIYEDERVDTRSDGSVFETSLITTFIGGSEQNWNRVITIFEDVTDRNKNQAALVEAKTMAENASKAKTEFLSSMSHELRTPLNAILGFSQLFEYDQSLGEQRQSNAREIYNAGQHLLKLIDQVLDLSRIEAGNIGISMEAVSLESIINDSLSWVAEMAASRGVKINFNPESCRGLFLQADSIRLKQVFLNLMTNAVKYNRDGGSVIILCSQDKNNCIRISIADTGPGISADRLKQLFKPFNRLGAEFTGVEGTGIGLVITRQLVHLMNGELQVESTPGKGTTFTVQFQLMQRDLAEEDASSNVINPGDETLITLIPAKPYILVAEDNLVNQELMAAQLRLLGYKADYAENGTEALKMWKSGDYRLLLTDIRMPEMDGYELMERIRAMKPKEPAKPVIAVTANAMEGDAQLCLDRGASDVLSKPFSLDDLRQMLEKWSVQQTTQQASEGNASQAPDPKTTAPVNLSMLRESVGDAIEVQRKLLKSFVDSLPKSLDEIHQAFARDDYRQLRESAHKLKSSSGSMGATELANICEVLELACRESREADVNVSVPQLLQAAGPVIVFVEDFCKDAVANSANKTVA